jgi:polyisoprenoid-binding protein YceI
MEAHLPGQSRGSLTAIDASGRESEMKIRDLALLPLLAAAALLTPLTRAQVPAFEITPVSSSVTFNVKSSVSIVGKFDKWNATLTMKSPDVTTAALDIQVQAASVNTGSGMKNGKLKSKDFFDVDENPLIEFKSDHCVQTGPTTFDVPGTFTIRGVSKPQTLRLTLSGKGTGSGEVKGSMAFDRKDYGINGSIPFITIADRVQVDVDLKAKKISGPQVVYKQ